MGSCARTRVLECESQARCMHACTEAPRSIYIVLCILYLSVLVGGWEQSQIPSFTGMQRADARYCVFTTSHDDQARRTRWVEGGVGQSREPKLSVCCLHTSAHPFLAKNRSGAPVFGHCPLFYVVSPSSPPKFGPNIGRFFGKRQEAPKMSQKRTPHVCRYSRKK